MGASQGYPASSSSSARGLRSVARAAVAAGAGVVVAIALLIVVVAGLSRQAAEEVVRDSQTLDVVERLERNLLYHVQISNIYVVEPNPAAADMRKTVHERILGLAATLDDLSDSNEERAAVARTREDIADYFHRRGNAEATEAALPSIVGRSTPALNEALAGIDELRRINERELDATHRRATLFRRLSAVAGGIAVVVVLAAVIGLVVFLRRELVGPLYELTSAASAFRAGDLDVRAPEQGPREVRDVARALNEAGAALAEQRRTRLTFVASVAHDLRTPLQALKISVELLRQEPDLQRRPHVATVIDRIDRQSERLLAMADDLADASQIEAGELTLDRQPIDLREPIGGMVELYRPTSPHTLDFVAPDEPVIVEADAVRIEQVASNLLSNAIKYAPGGGRIRVAIEPRGDHAIFSVSDEGPGIDPDAIDQLFLPFRRGKRSSHLVQGSGLGLSVAKRIVTSHGGSIEVRSERGVGTTFRVLLPRSGSPSSNG